MSMLRWALLTVLVALVVHAIVVLRAPSFIMSKAIERVSRNGAAVNAFTFGPQVSPASRAIVRPSPDLAYASCVYDLGDGPVRIRVAPWDDYVSLSLYAGNTDNFYTINDAAMAGQPVEIVLVTREQTPPSGAKVVVSPTRRGIALERRLAPNAERFALADAARRQSVCEPLRQKR